MSVRMKCAQCGKRPALSAVVGKCQVCLCAEEKGWPAALDQEARAIAERDADKAARKAAAK